MHWYTQLSTIHYICALFVFHACWQRRDKHTNALRETLYCQCALKRTSLTLSHIYSTVVAVAEQWITQYKGFAALCQDDELVRNTATRQLAHAPYERARPAASRPTVHSARGAPLAANGGACSRPWRHPPRPLTKEGNNIYSGRKRGATQKERQADGRLKPSRRRRRLKDAASLEDNTGTSGPFLFFLPGTKRPYFSLFRFARTPLFI